ncbi:MAG: flavoprotein oxidoreductase [Actinomycetia bacterium]|nr:flavoprotein oxidoreductase [Actinomycetes bacterium]
MTERLVVIGGDAAGMSAASQARRLRSEDDLEIIAFEKGEFTSYSACGTPYLVGKVVDDYRDLVSRTPEEHRMRGIDVRTGHEVTEIDTEGRTVTVLDAVLGTEATHPYDELLIATGAKPLRPPLEGVDGHGIFGLQSLTDGIALRTFIDAEQPQHAVVVGGGYIGLELAEALTLRKVHTTLVDHAPQPMSSLDPDMGAIVADALKGLGVDLRLGETVLGFDLDGSGHVRAVRTGSGPIPADIVVLGIGVRPNSGLALAAGIPIGTTGGITVDRRMHTPVDHVWAAGDCVETFHRVSRTQVAIALGTHANKQGLVAGTNIAGGYITFPGVIGTAATKVCDWEIARTGLRESDAQKAGFRTVAATVDATTRAGYYPDTQPIKVRIVAEDVSGRLLGAQIVGTEGAAKRIDVLAVAIWNEMTAGELVMTDISYAPPVAPVWDPILQAARIVYREARALGKKP